MTDEELKGLLEANATENRRHFNETADRLSAENRQFFERILTLSGVPPRRQDD